ncbi:hypothetical protein U1Q18_015624 [Sarracenia purpurea var. burkii]
MASPFFLCLLSLVVFWPLKLAVSLLGCSVVLLCIASLVWSLVYGRFCGLGPLGHDLSCSLGFGFIFGWFREVAPFKITGFALGYFKWFFTRTAIKSQRTKGIWLLSLVKSSS